MKLFKVLAMLLLMAIMAVPCYGYRIALDIDVGELDKYIGSGDLDNSGEDEELSFLGGELLPDYYNVADLTFIKYEDSESGLNWFPIIDNDEEPLTDIYALKFQELTNPEYFILKLGYVDGYNTHLLFANEDLNDYAVIDLEAAYFQSSVVTDLNTLDDFNIDKISHISFYAVSATPVPEPATMMLFGFGLIGMSAVFRKKQ